MFANSCASVVLALANDQQCAKVLPAIKIFRMYFSQDVRLLYVLSCTKRLLFILLLIHSKSQIRDGLIILECALRLRVFAMYDKPH